MSRILHHYEQCARSMLLAPASARHRWQRKVSKLFWQKSIIFTWLLRLTLSLPQVQGNRDLHDDWRRRQTIGRHRPATVSRCFLVANYMSAIYVREACAFVRLLKLVSGVVCVRLFAASARWCTPYEAVWIKASISIGKSSICRNCKLVGHLLLTNV